MSKIAGRLVVISGPSGVGKSSLCERLMQKSDLRRVVTCTTRAPRPGEEPGKAYHFLTPEEFEAKLNVGGFLEHATVHGNSYGTPGDEVEENLTQGTDLLLAIDVQGADTLRARFTDAASEPTEKRAADNLQPENLVTIFLVAPDDETLTRRLSGRGTEDAAELAVRLEAARREMLEKEKYDYTVVNDRLEDAADAVLEILRVPTP